MTSTKDGVVYLDRTFLDDIRQAAKLDNRTIKAFCQEHLSAAIQRTLQTRSNPTSQQP